MRTLELPQLARDGLLEKLLLVQGTSEGGPLDEVMPIGHTKKSHTFIPQIETVDGHTWCDCPGFLDNRGAEINIANAVNIKVALANAKSAKIIVLINYFSLRADSMSCGCALSSPAH